jgi:serine/threonine protein kinase
MRAAAMLETQCPDRSLLVAFQLGKLSPDLLEQVASHVETCPSCQEQLDHLSDQDDPLLAELRKVPPLPADLAAPSSDDAAHYPQVTGHRVLEELGKGGMGVVYRAWNVALNRPVAIKTVQAAYRGNQSAIERFRAEAQITSQLQHPGIPPVHEMGTLPDGRPYLTMKLVKGRTLAELLQQRPDPNTDRGRYLAIFEQVCHAVGYAHSHQVIHRDLKPANVMVGAHGEVQVMDWGLAKLLTQPTGPRETQPDLSQTVPLQTEIETPARDSSETRTGSVIGTPAYMPPEQAAGEVHRLGPRSDVFALGAILCQILTGRPPYRGSDANAVKIKAVRGELAEALAALEACGAEPELVTLC